MSKKYTTNFLEDTNGSTGSANQVLISTPSGIDWVDGSGSSIIGGPYLPLAGGTMTGTGSISMPDNFSLLLGGGIMKIFNDGSNSILRSQGEPLLIDANDITFRGYSPYNSLMTIKSTGNVGIGTTSPSEKLEISSTGNTAVRISTDGDAGDIPMLQLYRSSGAYGQVHYEADGGNNAGLHLTDFRNDTNSHIIFNTQGDNERMRIEADGNVGIGTTSPSEKLGVISSDNIGTTKIISAYSLSQSQSTSLGYNSIMGSYSLNVATLTTQPITFSPNSSEAMRITSTGNVGIGTTSPSQALEVNGIIKISNTYKQYLLQSHNTYGNLLLQQSGAATIPLTVNSANLGIGVGNISLQSALNVNGGIAAGSYYNTAAPANGMIISGNVGIGTNSPLAKTHIKASNAGGDSAASGTLIVEQGSAPSIQLLSANSQTQTIKFADPQSSQIGRISYSHPSDAMFFVTNGTERMRINSSGNVGIGTTSPDVKLHVGGNAKASNIYIADSIIHTGDVDTKIDFSTDGIGFDTAGSEKMNISSTGKVSISGTEDELLSLNATDDGAVYMSFERSNSRKGYVGFGGSGVNFSIANEAANGGITISAGGGEKMRIEAGGDVGIGTTNPQGTLHISDANPEFILEDTTNPNKCRIKNVDGNLFFEADYQNAFGNSRHQFYIDGSEKLRINTNGDIGIGTTSPNRKLSVENSSSSIIADFKYSGAGYSSIDLSNTSSFARLSSVNSDLLLSPAGTERMRVTNAGNVGIGTTSPGAKLHVAGFTRLENSGDKQLQFVGTGKNTFSIEHDTSRIYFYNETTASYPLAILNGGNVGIGTTSPTTKLHVTGITQIVESGNAAFYGGNYVRMFNDQNYNFRNSGGTTIANIAMSGNTYFNGGNVGIGTTSPSSKLHVYNGEAIIATSTDGLKLSYSVGNSSGIIDTAFSDNNLEFRTNGTTKMWIANAGNVGIGTTSPSAKLEIRSDGSAAVGAEIRLQHDNNNTNDVVSTINFANNAGSVGMIQAGTAGANNTGYIALFTDIAGSSSEKMRIASSGNVGIGTTNPDAKLHVTDSIRIDTGGAGPSAAPTTGTPTQAQVRNGGDETYYLSEPDTWLTVNIGGTDYVIPAYEA